jgi:hypothetical protein
LHTQIGLNFRAPVRLNRNGLRLLQKLDTAFPEGRLQKLPPIDPTDGSGGGAHFDAVIAAAHDVHTVAIVKGLDRFAHLRNAAPKGDAALADIAFANQFVFRSK